jgi:hypothetical protein
MNDNWMGLMRDLKKRSSRLDKNIFVNNIVSGTANAVSYNDVEGQMEDPANAGNIIEKQVYHRQNKGGLYELSKYFYRAVLDDSGVFDSISSFSSSTLLWICSPRHEISSHLLLPKARIISPKIPVEVARTPVQNTSLKSVIYLGGYLKC